MFHRITLRVVPAIILLSLLGTGVAQAFCFLKNSERRNGHSNGRMPAIGFSPSVYQGYPYSPLQQPARYEDRNLVPQQPLYDSRYTAGSGLQH